MGKAAFDKTGTLTRGVPEVTAVRSLSPGVTEEQVYDWLARAELGSEHPWAKRWSGVAGRRRRDARPGGGLRGPARPGPPGGAGRPYRPGRQ